MGLCHWERVVIIEFFYSNFSIIYNQSSKFLCWKFCFNSLTKVKRFAICVLKVNFIRVTMPPQSKHWIFSCNLHLHVLDTSIFNIGSSQMLWLHFSNLFIKSLKYFSKMYVRQFCFLNTKLIKSCKTVFLSFFCVKVTLIPFYVVVVLLFSMKIEF